MPSTTPIPHKAAQTIVQILSNKGTMAAIKRVSDTESVVTVKEV